MKIEFDHNKSIKNEKQRKLPFTMVAEFEWETAISKHKKGIRVISFRKANPREVRNYEAKIADKQER